MSTLDTTFAALADPTRRAILHRLQDGELPVTELAAPFQISLPAISRHVRVLEHAGLVRRERRGRHQHIHLRPRSLRAAETWLGHYRRFWEERLDDLAIYLQEEESE